MYLRASEMSKQAWSEAVKTNNLEEHMLFDPLYYSFGDKEQKCWGGASKCWGGAKHVGGGGCTNEVGGVRTPRTPPENPPVCKIPWGPRAISAALFPTELASAILCFHY